MRLTELAYALSHEDNARIKNDLAAIIEHCDRDDLIGELKKSGFLKINTKAEAHLYLRVEKLKGLFAPEHRIGVTFYFDGSYEVMAAYRGL